MLETSIGVCVFVCIKGAGSQVAAPEVCARKLYLHTLSLFVSLGLQIPTCWPCSCFVKSSVMRRGPLPVQDLYVVLAPVAFVLLVLDFSGIINRKLVVASSNEGIPLVYLTKFAYPEVHNCYGTLIAT